jgi:hypothetical protein
MSTTQYSISSFMSADAASGRDRPRKSNQDMSLVGINKCRVKEIKSASGDVEIMT